MNGAFIEFDITGNVIDVRICTESYEEERRIERCLADLVRISPAGEERMMNSQRSKLHQGCHFAITQEWHREQEKNQ